MLKVLKIKNFALIKEFEFYPKDGLNIITGETGAGKSIVINSLSLILGKRADTGFIRTGEKKLSVEGVFDITPEVQSLLEGEGYDSQENELTITREVHATGKSRAFVNDSPANLSLLESIGSLLVDLHGQHDHQSLFNKDIHLSIIDEYVGLTDDKFFDELNTYKNQFSEYRKAKKKLSELLEKSSEMKEKLELLNYQKKEITRVAPKIDEDTEIHEELKKLERVEDIKKSASICENLVEGNKFSVISAIEQLKEQCEELSNFNPDLLAYEKDLESALITISDFVNDARYFADTVEFDEEEYNSLSDRYNELSKLKKKFGPDISDVLEYEKKIDVELSDGVDFDEVIEKTEKRSKDLYSDVLKRSGEISIKRLKGAESFCNAVNKELAQVGLKNASLKVDFTKSEPTADGIDKAEFFIRTNVGDTYKPLKKTASGGEISRVMLSIKNVMSSQNSAPTLIFDEIDTGISGHVAELVAKKLEELSYRRQVFVITHLPVIASKGSTHFKAEKMVVNNSTETKLTYLTVSDRIKEISSMIGGDLTQASLSKAEELLKI